MSKQKKKATAAGIALQLFGGWSRLHISQRQRDWLVNVDREEGRVADIVGATQVYFDDHFYEIELNKVKGYTATKHVKIRFVDSGKERAYPWPALQQLQKLEIEYKIINPREL